MLTLRVISVYVQDRTSDHLSDIGAVHTASRERGWSRVPNTEALSVRTGLRAGTSSLVAVQVS